MWNEKKGQAGGITTFFILTVVFAFVYIFLGVVMSKVTELSKVLMQDYPATQQHIDAMNFMFQTWYILPIIVTIFLFFFLIHNALRKKPGEV